MAEVKDRWSEFGERVEALALKLKLHVEQAGRAEVAPDLVQKLRDQVSDAFDGVGNAVRDDAVKADARESGRLFLDALSATFAEVAERLKERPEPPAPPK